MARRNYLVEGLSGAGKSSVYEELIRRGYMAISTDRAWKVDAGDDAGLPARPLRASWDERKALGELESPEPDALFVCGSSGNRDRFLPYFTKVFNLRIDDDTMRRRLDERTNNDFGKQPEELELMLTLNRDGEQPAGAVDLDATRPLDEVVGELLLLADCAPVASDATVPPWSSRRSATARSFVISEPALPAFRATADVPSLEYAWSGDVLATLLPYLEEQGIDLVHADHQPLAPPIAEGRGSSVLVLVPEHRERYEQRLDPSAFDGAELRRFYEERNETRAAGVEYAMLDGIAFLRDTLAALGPATVAVLVIGRLR